MFAQYTNAPLTWMPRPSGYYRDTLDEEEIVDSPRSLHIVEESDSDKGSPTPVTSRPCDIVTMVTSLVPIPKICETLSATLDEVYDAMTSFLEAGRLDSVSVVDIPMRGKVLTRRLVNIARIYLLREPDMIQATMRRVLVADGWYNDVRVPSSPTIGRVYQILAGQKVARGKRDLDEAARSGNIEPTDCLTVVKKRRNFTVEQKAALERFFEAKPYPDTEEFESLASSLDRDRNSIKTWFHNRRVKWRKTSKDAPRTASVSSLPTADVLPRPDPSSRLPTSPSPAHATSQDHVPTADTQQQPSSLPHPPIASSPRPYPPCRFQSSNQPLNLHLPASSGHELASSLPVRTPHHGFMNPTVLTPTGLSMVHQGYPHHDPVAQLSYGAQYQHHTPAQPGYVWTGPALTDPRYGPSCLDYSWTLSPWLHNSTSLPGTYQTGTEPQPYSYANTHSQQFAIHRPQPSYPNQRQDLAWNYDGAGPFRPT